ncbi:MAG: ABC transporter substrate-binding protein, partial [Candidatus Thorarchaeota archaeon]
VQFHDGSNWNATVAKWNIDRLYLITGNLTGNANGIYDFRNAGYFWQDVEYVKPYFTESWNLSEYDAPDATGDPTYIPPDPGRYAYYYLSDPDGPSPKIANNSNPFGGWDPVSNNWIHYAPYDKFPLVRWVEVVEDQPSGGKIRVEFNDWNSYKIEGGINIPQISMQAYRNYNETGIYGYQNGNDMIGTGPYKFVSHNEILDRGLMLKNENYWNKTDLEADGWFNADRVEIIQFTPGDLGRDYLNNALLCHEVDYAFDTPPNLLDYDAIMAHPNINYIEYGLSDYITQITLNCINETWWSGGVMYPGESYEFNFSWVDINAMYKHCNADPAANGIPRILRKALSYAFDYDSFIHVDMDDRVVRAGGMLGVENHYYNSSIPLAVYNLEYAREILLNFTEHDVYSLTDPLWAGNADKHNFSKQLTMRGVTDPSDNPANNALWQAVAANNPIFTINFYWDDAHQNLADQFELACNNLGVALVQDADNKAPSGTTLWDHCIGSYWTTTFDGVHSIWSAQAWPMEYPMPETIPEVWVLANYGDPNHGSWRSDNVTELWPSWNFGFCYDSEVDQWLTHIEYSDESEKLNWFSKIAEKEQTELYPMIYVSQGKEGRALWDHWEVNFNRGDLFFANFRYVLPHALPGYIDLSSDADNPDIDGKFNLIWNVSTGADNYSIYRNGSKITEINGTLVLIADQNATSPFTVTGLLNGEYYFVVVAYNQYGSTLSNNVDVTVNILGEPTGFEISGYNILLISCITVCTAVIGTKKRKIKFRLK